VFELDVLLVYSMGFASGVPRVNPTVYLLVFLTDLLSKQDAE
jgi:hypothetical protein